MKLLMISGDRSVAAGKSGAFSETLKELHVHFERIDIICPAIKSDQQVRVLHGNVYLHPASGGLLSQPSYILQKGRELFKAHSHDVMTVHDYPPFYNGIGARWLQASIRIPAVVEIHHVVGWPKAAGIMEFFGRLLSRMFLPSHLTKFAAVRVVSGATQRLLLAWGVPPRHVTVVPSFYLHHEAIRSAKNQSKKYDLVFCSRLVANKGLLATIDALHDLPDATMLVVGDGPLRRTAEERAKDIRSRISFTGWLPTHDDVLNAVASGKVFVMNSGSEGGPRSALEAMALGLPVLATKVGVMPDVVREGVNGFFIDGSSSDLAQKASKLLADPLQIAAMSSEAAKVTDAYERTSLIKAYANFLKAQVH